MHSRPAQLKALYVATLQFSAGCGDCGHDKLVAFSCKRRGFCPSCGARRMVQTAAHLVEHFIPLVPVRQWVLSLPIPLRVLLARSPSWSRWCCRWCSAWSRAICWTTPGSMPLGATVVPSR